MASPSGQALGLALLLALAAVLRLPGIDGRGRFEFDQGQDMLVLRAFVDQGVVPLLGPKTSVGVFHHGAFEYFLLAPGAWLSGAQPVGVILELALIGIAAVVVAWWMGRVIGGPLVGLVAGLLVTVSPAAVDESIFIWNPNPVPLFAGLSAGAAWRARQTGRARWWTVAVAAAAAVANLHILGAIFVVPIVALLAVDLRQARRAHDVPRARGALRGAAGGVIIAIVIYLPLIASELQTGFTETRAILDYIAGGGVAAGGSTLEFLPRLLVITLRVLGWPFVGLVTDVPILASIVVGIAVALVAWLAIRGRGEVGAAGRWLAASIAWSIVALAVAAPQLATVVAILPNDHYHSFADPLILVAVALAGVELSRRLVERHRAGRPHGPAGSSAPIVGAVVAGLLVAASGFGVALVRQPSPDPNGGWPGARAAGEHVVATVTRDARGATSPRIAVVNLPDFEPPTWISYPIVYATDAADRPSPLTDNPTRGDYVVLGCDRAFVVQIGATCGEPAAEAWLPRLSGSLAARLQLVERFDLSARINVSIYRVDAQGP